MIRVGIVGIGFMGMIHHLAYKQVRGISLAAICSRDEKKLAGDWRGIQGNFGPPGEQIDMRGIRGYRELDKLLADDSIDLVDICLPPYLHADATVAALQAGKHVFCEKPIAVSEADAKRMVKAADKSGKQLLIGHVLPFVPEFAYVYEAVKTGKYGALLGGHFKRTISNPAWLPDFYHPQRVGGPLIDLNIHDTHFVRLLCGQPTSVASVGRMHSGDSGSDAPSVCEYVDTQFRYADRNVAVTVSGGVVQQAGRAFTHAFEVHFEQATLLFDFAVLDGQAVTLMPLTALAGKKVTRPKLSGGDPVLGFVAEIKEVVRSITSGDVSSLLSAELARDALTLCYRQTEAVRTGRIVRV